MPIKDTKKTELVRKLRAQRGPWLLIILVVVIVAVVGFGIFELTKRVNHIAYQNVKIGNQTYKLEVADTEAARIKGLSQRDSLPANTGMLFNFKTDGDWRIWMIDMHFNIDIMWLNESGKIVHVKENATPAEYPEIYHANQPNRYVIELSAGSIERLSLKVGDAIDIGL
jgi:uncharacterized protein